MVPDQHRKWPVRTAVRLRTLRHGTDNFLGNSAPHQGRRPPDSRMPLYPGHSTLGYHAGVSRRPYGTNTRALDLDMELLPSHSGWRTVKRVQESISRRLPCH